MIYAFPSSFPNRSRCTLQQWKSLGQLKFVKTGFRGTNRGEPLIGRAIFGVGAPEAALVVVVALVVFGPKGLAETARSIGKTLRGFAPTLRELAEVSSELKTTFEQEIGLNEIQKDLRDAVNPNLMTRPLPKPRFDSKDIEIDPEIEAKRRASAELSWSGESQATSIETEISAHKTNSDSFPSSIEVETSGFGSSVEAKASNSSLEFVSEGQSQDLTSLTTEELEAELAKRRNSNETS